MSVTPNRYQSLAKFNSHISDGCMRNELFSQCAVSLGLAIISGLSLAGVPAIAQPAPVIQLAQVPERARAIGNLNLLHVNPIAGDDWQGKGGERTPFKTITKALQVAKPNTVIVLIPGTYSAQTGESFPLRLKPGVTIQGDPRMQGKDIVIQGGGPFLSPTFASQNITILGVNQGGLAGVTVTNPNPRGYGLWIESASPVILGNTFRGNPHDGISITGSSAPMIRGNVFYENGANGMTIYGSSRPEVQDNLFTKTGFGINIAQNATPLIVGNRILQNEDGVVVQANAQPILRGNVIEGNLRDGLVAIAQARPHLGNATDPGNNVFSKNGRFDINASASNQVIPAFGNQLASNQTSGRLDFAGTTSISSSQPPTPIAQQPPAPGSSLRADNPSQPLVVSQVTPAAQKAEPKPTPAKAEPQASSVVAKASTPIATKPEPQSAPEIPSKPAISKKPAKPLASSATPASRPTASPTQTAVVPISVPPPETARSAATLAPLPQQSDAAAIPVPPSTTPRPQTTTPAKTPAKKPEISAASFPVPALEKAPQMAAAPAPIAETPPSPALRSQPISAYSFRTRPAPATARSQPTPTPAKPATTTPEPAAIEIPVPPPDSSTAKPPVRPTPAVVASRPALERRSQVALQRPTPEATTINIPVPPPESGAVVPAAPTLAIAAPTPAPAIAALPNLNDPSNSSGNILPVPGPDIPIGDGGGELPTVLVARNPLDGTPNFPPPPASRSAALGLRYRVIVEVGDESEQAQVQSLIPGAFRTIANGRMVMQVGSYSDRANAEKMVGELGSQGLQATIEQLN